MARSRFLRGLKGRQGSRYLHRRKGEAFGPPWLEAAGLGSRRWAGGRWVRGHVWLPLTWGRQTWGRRQGLIKPWPNANDGISELPGVGIASRLPTGLTHGRLASWPLGFLFVDKGDGVQAGCWRW